MISLFDAYEKIDNLFKNLTLVEMELLIIIAKEKYKDKQVLDLEPEFKKVIDENFEELFQDENK